MPFPWTHHQVLGVSGIHELPHGIRPQIASCIRGIDGVECDDKGEGRACLTVNSQHHGNVCDPKQGLALLHFKNVFSLDMPSSSWSELYPRTFTWNETTDCCLWDGVECDDEGQGHIVGLHLGCSLLHGTLHPNNTLFTLSHLKTLNLSYNNFAGSPLSPQFGMLSNLRVLDLSGSSFKGHVPL
uniref:Leucine-rich repeat-containing N-terminal plant-type domain-containing protein n=1 Tax=Cucumis melo TaxID=3656 RepID=A0A9I9EL15_CUCME